MSERVSAVFGVSILSPNEMLGTTLRISSLSIE